MPQGRPLPPPPLPCDSDRAMKMMTLFPLAPVRLCRTGLEPSRDSCCVRQRLAPSGRRSPCTYVCTYIRAWNVCREKPPVVEVLDQQIPTCSLILVVLFPRESTLQEALCLKSIFAFDLANPKDELIPTCLPIGASFWVQRRVLETTLFGQRKEKYEAHVTLASGAVCTLYE